MCHICVLFDLVSARLWETVVSPVVGACVVISVILLAVPFPCWVAAEQKGGQAGGKYIAGHPSLGRDRSPLLAFLSLIWSYLAERGR